MSKNFKNSLRIISLSVLLFLGFFFMKPDAALARPIATWNIEGNTRRVYDSPTSFTDYNTLEDVIDLMENPGPDIGPIEVMALQEVTAGTLQERTRAIPGVQNYVFTATNNQTDRGTTILVEISFDIIRNGRNIHYLFFHTTRLFEGLGAAIVLRDPPPRNQINAVAYNHPVNPDNLRSYLGVEIQGIRNAGIYYSIHAQPINRRTLNDADRLLNDIFQRHPNAPGQTQVFVLGDINRDIATPDNPNNINAGDGLFDSALSRLIRRPNSLTFNARERPLRHTLDYMFTHANLRNSAGTVLTRTFGAPNGLRGYPSDHLPVLYNDDIRRIRGGDATVTVSQDTQINSSLSTSTVVPVPTATNVPLHDVSSVSTLDGFELSFEGDGRRVGEPDKITLVSDDSPEGKQFGDDYIDGYRLDFGNYSTIRNISVDESTNTIGFSPEVINGLNYIILNFHGHTIPPSSHFTLLVTTDDQRE